MPKHGADTQKIKKTKKNLGGGKVDVKTLKRKIRNTVKDTIQVVKKFAPYTPNLIGPIPNKVLIDVLEGKRDAKLYPPHIRTFLKNNGNEVIQSITVVRTPIETVVKKLLDFISLGTYQKAVSEANYDNMFHLALFINGKYTLDKQETVKLSSNNPIKKNSESLNVNLNGKSITFNDLLENTRKYMGDNQFSNYDANKNNCQDFVISILKANGLDTPELTSFIKQDAQAVFSKLPSFTEKLAHTLTDIGAVANKVIEGENIKKRKPSAWQEYLSVHMKGKTFKSKQASQDYLKKLSVSYKKQQKKLVK